MPALFPTKPGYSCKILLNWRSQQPLLVNQLCREDVIDLPFFLYDIAWRRDCSSFVFKLAEKSLSSPIGFPKDHGPHSVFVLVSISCCNKVSKTEWLETIATHCFTALEARSTKSRYQQGHTLSNSSGGGSFRASFSFWYLPAILGVFFPQWTQFQNPQHDI